MTDRRQDVESAFTPPPHADRSQYKKQPRGIRADANILCLWALCRNNGCRRARACGSTGQDCVSAYSALVPLMVRLWVMRLFWNRELGSSFDEALEEMKGSPEQEALEAWHQTVHATLRIR